MRELRSTGPGKEFHLKVRKNRVRESRDDQVFNLLTLLVLMLVNLVIANPLIYIVSASFFFRQYRHGWTGVAAADGFFL